MAKTRALYAVSDILCSVRLFQTMAFAFAFHIAIASNGGAIDENRWDSIASWVYQLQNYRGGKLDEIAASGYDLAVIDLARDGASDYFTKNEIAAVKRTGKKILSYFEIGAIEKYRPEWKNLPKNLILEPVPEWPEEHFVKFWDERWWQVLKKRIDRSIDAGFDGAYLDILTAYQEISLKSLGRNPPDRKKLASRMAALVVKIAEYAKKRNPNYKIFPQNCPELFSGDAWNGKQNDAYNAAIDGMGMESLFFMPMDKPADKKWCEENRRMAAGVAKAGKTLLGVDYCVKPENVAKSNAMTRKLGGVPFQSVENLDQCPKTHSGKKRKPNTVKRNKTEKK